MGVGTSRSKRAHTGTSTSTEEPASIPALPSSLATFTSLEAADHFRAIFARECIVERKVATKFFKYSIRPMLTATLHSNYTIHNAFRCVTFY